MLLAGIIIGFFLGFIVIGIAAGISVRRDKGREEKERLNEMGAKVSRLDESYGRMRLNQDAMRFFLGGLPSCNLNPYNYRGSFIPAYERLLAIEEYLGLEIFRAHLGEKAEARKKATPKKEK